MFYSLPKRILNATRARVSNKINSTVNRCHVLLTKKRTEKEWAKLLGLDDSSTLITAQVAEKFYSDESAIFPNGFHSFHKCASKVEGLINNTLKHYFDLLGSGLVNLDIPDKSSSTNQMSDSFRVDASFQRKKIKKAICEIDESSPLLENLKKYNPIDWQLDFKSGHRWSNKSWSMNIQPGEPHGVEIKLPWELSRFYHAGPMGLYWTYSKKSSVIDEFQLQIIDWIVGNQVYYGVNWRNAMEAGLRAANWLLGMSFFKGDKELSPEFLLIVHKSFYEHGCFIERNLENKCGSVNNHYIANLVGLISIGAAMPWMSKSDTWLLFGIQELISEMRRQVCPDGSHFEGSTSYHRFVTEMFVACYEIVASLPEARRRRLSANYLSSNISNGGLTISHKQEFSLDDSEVFPEWFLQRLSLMVGFVKDISKSNGSIPQIGDNDSGRLFWLPLPFKENGNEVTWELNEYRGLLNTADRILDDRPVSEKVVEESIKKSGGAVWYPDFGIAIYNVESLYLAITCGGGCPGVNSGHKHNDKLSFELNFYGDDFIVDPGTYVYTPEPAARNRFRSTWSHNTLVFQGKEQNHISDTKLFQLSDTANATLLHFDGSRFIGKHNGYGFTCKREFVINENTLCIKDTSEKPGGYCLLNLHPDVAWEDGRLIKKGRSLKMDFDNIGEVSVQESFYSPRYGVILKSKRLYLKRNSEVSTFSFSWD